MDINQFNLEMGVFLRRLRMFSDQDRPQINEKTTEMLMDMILIIDKLIANSETVPTSDNQSVNFLFNLDEQNFDFRLHVMCRLCIVSFRVLHRIMNLILNCVFIFFRRNKFPFRKMILKII